MSKTLENLIEQATELLKRYDGAVLLLEKKAEDYSVRLAHETDDSIALLKKEIAILDVDETINILRSVSNKNIEALTVKSQEITAEMEQKLQNLDIEQVIADFKTEADAIVKSIKDEVITTSQNNMTNFTILSSKNIKLNRDSSCVQGSSTYSSLIKVAKNRFAIAKLLFGSGRTEATLTPFTIDGNGKLSVSEPAQMFLNISGAGISTTQFFSADNTGKLFAYGHNMYPGQSSHQFGYFYGRVNENNNVVDVGYSTDLNYHQNNGQYGGMLDGDGNGFYADGSSYNQSDSKQRSIHINYSGDTPSLKVHNPSSDTSTGYASHFIGQEGVSNAGITGIVHYRTSANAYKERAFNSDGSSAEYEISGWDSEMVAFVLSNGKVLNITRGSAGYIACVYAAYNNRTIVNDINFDLNHFYPYWSNANITNVAKDTWLVFNYQIRAIFTMHINPDTYEMTIIDGIDSGLLTGNNSQLSVKVGGASNEFLIVSQHQENNFQTVKVVKNPLKMKK